MFETKTLEPRLIATLGLAATLGYASVHIMLPALPAIQDHFQVDLARVQLTLSLAFIFTGVGHFVVGLLSDRLGRRRVLLVSLLIFVAGSLLAGTANSINVVILGRALQAFSGSAGITIARALVLDHYPRDQAASALAYVILPFTLVPLLLPLVGGLLTDGIGWRATFFFIGGIGIVSLLMVKYTVRPAAPKQDPPRRILVWSHFGALFRSRRFVGFMAHHACTVIAGQALVAVAPVIIIKQMGLSPTQYGLAFMVPAVTAVAGAVAAGRFTIRFGGDRVILLGCLVALLGHALVLVMTLLDALTAAVFFGAYSIVSFAMTASIPSSSTAALEHCAGNRGLGAGTIGLVQWLMTGVVIQLLAFVVERHQVVMFSTILTVELLALGGFYYAKSASAAAMHESSAIDG